MEEREEKYTAKESPCKYCTEHRAGCHVPECTHGWWEWHLWQQERAKEIRKKEWLESRLSIVGKKKMPRQKPSAAVKAMAKNGGKER